MQLVETLIIYITEQAIRRRKFWCERASKKRWV